MPQVKKFSQKKNIKLTAMQGMLPDSQGCWGDGGAVANKVSGINIQLPFDYERAIQTASHLSEEMADVSDIYLSPFLSL